MNVGLRLNKNKFVLFLLCLCCLFTIGCRNKSNKPPARPVPALKAQLSTIPLYKKYIGITQSIAAVGIRARVKGFLEQMLFVEGKAVKKDQLLFVIDPTFRTHF